MAAEDDSRWCNEDAPTDLYRQSGEQRNSLLDDQIGKDRVEDLSQCAQFARMVCDATRGILNSETNLQSCSLPGLGCSAPDYG